MSTELQNQALEEANKKIRQLEIQSAIHQALIMNILGHMSLEDLNGIPSYIAPTDSETDKQIKQGTLAMIRKAAEFAEIKAG
ncbi:hypothetical protein V1951_17025 [Yersinia sp. 2544 StPb PI]|uniref:hypothetical protein n=1 Tax=unclassified Yersinia (in: enterobacteria) TaxID=2653513 RepID=UPI003B289DAD